MATKPRRERRDQRRAGTRAVTVSFVTSLVVGIAKVAGFVVTGSTSLLAEAVHSVADTGHQVLLVLGRRRARVAYFWSFVVAIALFSVGSAFVVLEGVQQLDQPEPITDPTWAFAALGIAVVVKGLSLRTTIMEANDARGAAGYWQFMRRSKRPALPAILLEDLGAVMGLLLAVGGVTLSVVTDDARWDGYATVAIGVVLAIIALLLVVELKALLIGGSASRKDLETMRAAIEIEPDVIRIVDLRTEQIGPDELLLGAKIEVMHELTVAELATTIDRIERSIRTSVPTARFVFLEPDVHHDHRTDGFVEVHEGHIDPDDPAYADIVGRKPTIDPDDEIWSN